MSLLSQQKPSFTLGTRGSALALWQADHVQGLLEGAGFSVTQERIVTRGDKILDKPLALIEGKSLFTKELDVALIEGRIDLAVHSLKDLPSELPQGLTLAAISPRENPHDAFVAHPAYNGTLEGLPEGAIIATSSLRRTAQLKAWRPDLQVIPVRGNVDTRLAKLDASNWHGIVLAAAGLIRIGFADRIHTIFDRQLMLPAVGQGALGIVCAEAHADIAQLLATHLHDAQTAAAVRAERAFLKCLEGSCHVPVGGFAHWNEDGVLNLEGLVASMDGREVVKGAIEVNPAHPEEAGTLLATQLLAEGAGEILQLVKL
ncbi:MAG: hydroxymethylbilane synthase [Bacteroidota bacterium]